MKREDIAAAISLLPHDYYSLVKMIDLREYSRRNEKMTSVQIPVELTKEEIIEITKDYISSRPDDEKASVQARRVKDVYLNVEYNEYDYSRTRLIQRQKHDAGIEFISEANYLTIRMPATEKASSIVRDLKERIEQKKKLSLDSRVIDVSNFSSDERTRFFIYVMRNIVGYPLETVVSLKVASSLDRAADVDSEPNEEDDGAQDEILFIVNNVALSGTNLLASDQYQTLREKGFFITAITWQSVQTEHPNDKMQFTAEFDEALEGVGFRYNVRISKHIAADRHAKHFSALEESRKPSLWRLLEASSWMAVNTIIQEKDLSKRNAIDEFEK